MMKAESKISLFTNCTEVKPVIEIPVLDFCLNVMNGDCKTFVENVRGEGGKEAKKTVPAVTASGVFSERKKEGLIAHSGFIAIDLDAKENPSVTDWREARDHIAQSPNVYFAALSISGNGVFALIPITNPEKHEAHFDFMKMAFRKIGYEIDGSGRDVSRLRFVSYDPDAKLNPDAKSVSRTYTPDRRPIRPLSKNSTSHLDRMIDKLIQSGADITQGYDNWLEVGRAIVNEYGEAGRGIYHQLSRVNPDYREEECDRKFNACLRKSGNATGKTIFYLAKQNGVMLK